MDSRLTARNTLYWALASAVLMVLGGFGTWATALGFSVSGTDGDGWFLIVGGIAAGVETGRRLTAPRPRKVGLVAMAVVGGICALIAIIDLVDIGSFADDGILGDLVSPGWGLYLSVLASLSLIAASVVALRQPAAQAPAAG